MAARGRGHFSINGFFFTNIPCFQPISAITLIKFKLFSSNFTKLFTVTRATFWQIDNICSALLSSYLPLWTWGKHWHDHGFCTIEAIIIKLHIFVHHHMGIILTKGHHPFMPLDLNVSLYGLIKSQMWPLCLHCWSYSHQSSQTCLQKHKCYI